MRYHALALSLALALPPAAAFIASPAHAASDDRAIALELFEQGRALFKTSNYEAALAKFEAAAKVMRTFGILLNIAECQEKSGRTASAWATWREARAVALEAHVASDEAMAAERQKALEPRLSRLTIIVPPAAGTPELEVGRDGGVVPREAWGAAIAVDPGQHVIEARAPGRKTQRIDMTVRPNGDRAIATIAPLDVEAPAPPPAAPQTPPPERVLPPLGVEAQDSGAGQRVAGWLLGGLGLVSLGAGIGIAVVGQNKHDEAVATDLAGNLPLAQEMESTANTTKMVGYSVIGGGGAFLVSGVILLLTAHSRSDARVSAVAFRPWVSFTGGGGVVFSKVW